MKLYIRGILTVAMALLGGISCAAPASNDFDAPIKLAPKTKIAQVFKAEDKPNVPFVHPGLLTGADELAVIQKRVQTADPNDPIYAGYLSTMARKYADMNYQPTPVARVKRGDLKPLDSPVLERDGAMVSYTLALKWVATGDVAARDKALSIMDAWAEVFETQEGDENRFLDSAWVTPVWCSAGELMLYGKVDGQSAPWPAEKVEKFKTMIRHLNALSSKIITQPFNPASNWGTSAFLADMAAGVFLDDHEIYQRGRDAMLKHLPQIIKKAGYCNEVFRDPWHGIVALSGTIQAAEIGRHQGDLSIYHARYDGQDAPRLLISVRWYADPLRGIAVPLPPMGGKNWKPDAWEFDAKGSSRKTGGFEIALNFYGWIEPAPNLESFRDAVLKTYRPSGQDNSLFIQSDTFTHGDLYAPQFPHPAHP